MQDVESFARVRSPPVIRIGQPFKVNMCNKSQTLDMAPFLYYHYPT
jgi:hypothetical protein